MFVKHFSLKHILKNISQPGHMLQICLYLKSISASICLQTDRNLIKKTLCVARSLDSVQFLRNYHVYLREFLVNEEKSRGKKPKILYQCLGTDINTWYLYNQNRCTCFCKTRYRRSFSQYNILWQKLCAAKGYIFQLMYLSDGQLIDCWPFKNELKHAVK